MLPHPDEQALMSSFRAYRIRAINHTVQGGYEDLTLNDLGAAFDRVLSGRHMGRIVVRINHNSR